MARTKKNREAARALRLVASLRVSVEKDGALSLLALPSKPQGPAFIAAYHSLLRAGYYRNRTKRGRLAAIDRAIASLGAEP